MAAAHRLLVSGALLGAFLLIHQSTSERKRDAYASPHPPGKGTPSSLPQPVRRWYLVRSRAAGPGTPRKQMARDTVTLRPSWDDSRQRGWGAADGGGSGSWFQPEVPSVG